MVVPVEVALGRPRKEDEPLRDALRRVLEKLGIDGKRGHREQGKKRSGPTRSLLMWTWRERQARGTMGMEETWRLGVNRGGEDRR